ncbi:MerR family transcriptional regulator [Micromonospora sp. NPDC049679]|uniref:DNA polymerase III subunit beta family protein n=1 Tax=Micromonospora sp. NPDC049679 TaxID=3155920 RepID=UPI0033D7B06A
MRSIGQMARASGLSVSALRFYDGAGVLVPAMVHPETGYRWYGPEQLRPARVVARLRRVGMPLADIARVLEQWPDAGAVRRLLDGHLCRLEAGLADARRELSRVHAVLDQEENVMTIARTPVRLTATAAELAAGIDAVRFAVGDDPAFPMLTGVLIEVEASVLRLVATDRYRMAIAEVPVTGVVGPPTSLIAPAAFVDGVRALLPAAGTAAVTVDADGITVRADRRQVGAEGVEHDFPDYRRALRDRGTTDTARRVAVDVAALRASLADAPTRTVVREHEGVQCEVVVLAVEPAGTLTVAGAEPQGGAETHVGVNREFLLEALAAGGRGQLVLELDGPIRPLAVRLPDDDGTFSILMPTVLS